MAYFSKRNNLMVEFSGHEEVSGALRSRLTAVLNKYVGHNGVSFGNDAPWNVEGKNFAHIVKREILSDDPFEIIQNGEFHQVFTVVEIFLDMIRKIYYTRRNSALVEIVQCFELSGSVYTFNRDWEIELKIDENLARKIEDAKTILSPYEAAYKTFFDAVGDLVGRKTQPKDVLKNLFVASESYLKSITTENLFGDAVNKLFNNKKINREQKTIMGQLNGFACDSFGVKHAGNSPEPSEIDVLWFLETLISQLTNIDKKIK